jgi:ribokinase
MIVVFGSINLDLIFALPHIPAPGETVLGPDTRIEPGGKGANQAIAAARDGARVIMAGAVGRDALAADALRMLADADVDLSRVARTDRTTGCAAIAVDPQGRNAIAVGSGANLLARADAVEDALLTPETTLLLQMEVPAEQTTTLIRRAKARQARVILNLAPALPIDAMDAVDILIVNETEAAWLAERLGTAAGAAVIQTALGTTVIRTLGEDGVETATARIPARRITPVDTTAAGDCFVGVIAAALDRGMPLTEAIERANAAAALCCTRPGSQGSIPWARETDAFMNGTGH